MGNNKLKWWTGCGSALIAITKPNPAKVKRLKFSERLPNIFNRFLSLDFDNVAIRVRSCSGWRMVSEKRVPATANRRSTREKNRSSRHFRGGGIRSLILTIPSNRRWHIPLVWRFAIVPATDASASSFSLALYSVVYVSHFDLIGL